MAREVAVIYPVNILIFHPYVSVYQRVTIIIHDFRSVSCHVPTTNGYFPTINAYFPTTNAYFPTTDGHFPTINGSPVSSATLASSALRSGSAPKQKWPSLAAPLRGVPVGPRWVPGRSRWAGWAIFIVYKPYNRKTKYIPSGNQTWQWKIPCEWRF